MLVQGFFLNLTVPACRIFSCSMKTLGHGMRNLVHRPGIRPGPPAVRAFRSSRWTIKEVTQFRFISCNKWAAQLRGVSSKGGCACVPSGQGQGQYFPLHFALSLKLLRKLDSLLKNKNKNNVNCQSWHQRPNRQPVRVQRSICGQRRINYHEKQPKRHSNGINIEEINWRMKRWSKLSPPLKEPTGFTHPCRSVRIKGRAQACVAGKT